MNEYQSSTFICGGTIKKVSKLEKREKWSVERLWPGCYYLYVGDYVASIADNTKELLDFLHANY